MSLTVTKQPCLSLPNEWLDVHAVGAVREELERALQMAETRDASCSKHFRDIQGQQNKCMHLVNAAHRSRWMWCSRAAAS